ncbi:MAG: hypothetical protein JO051_08105 [Acidobacteriaceae bacterium]|nr:hypothetical protein [Acidobacteriaceae bacterium]
MATLHHKRQDADISQAANEMRDAIQTFLGQCRSPAVLEYGEPIQPLTSGEYCLEDRSGRLWIEVSSDTRTFARRILSIDKHATGVLECSIHRFGGKPGSISFLDLDRPQTAHKAATGVRRTFAEQFRRMLCRHFPGWEITALTSSLDLRRSFSSVFPRALLVRSHQQIAALACPTAEEESAFLTFALLWLDHARAHARTGTRTSLVLFLPAQAGNLTAHRVRWLNGHTEVHMFRFNEHGSAGEVDPRDLGNLDTRVQKVAFDQDPESASVHHAIDSSERSFEWAVRQNIQALTSTLLPRPVHSQVLAFAAGDRDLIDLLAVSPAGRLAVLELKVAEDIHLPVQALDYWMRVKWHVERNELQHLFPGIPLAQTAPKLLLVAPAMAFHSSCATVLRYLSSEVEVERVGINTDWQNRFRVVLRLEGGNDPISHGSF